MISGLERLKSRRMWFVPGFQVWGMADWGELEFLVSENLSGTESVLFGSLGIGDTAQQATFGDLCDHRGNQLPEQLSAPRVLVRSRSAHTAFVVGNESASGFKIACDPDAGSPVTVDLLVIEMGD